MSLLRIHAAFLSGSIPFHGVTASDALAMKIHAPATAPNTIVAFDQ